MTLTNAQLVRAIKLYTKSTHFSDDFERELLARIRDGRAILAETSDKQEAVRFTARDMVECAQEAIRLHSQSAAGDADQSEDWVNPAPGLPKSGCECASPFHCSVSQQCHKAAIKQEKGDEQTR